MTVAASLHCHLAMFTKKSQALIDSTVVVEPETLTYPGQTENAGAIEHLRVDRAAEGQLLDTPEANRLARIKQRGKLLIVYRRILRDPLDSTTRVSRTVWLTVTSPASSTVIVNVRR